MTDQPTTAELNAELDPDVDRRAGGPTNAELAAGILEHDAVDPEIDFEAYRKLVPQRPNRPPVGTSASADFDVLLIETTDLAFRIADQLANGAWPANLGWGDVAGLGTATRKLRAVAAMLGVDPTAPKGLTIDDLVAGYGHPEYLGFGYLGERGRAAAHPVTVRVADRAALERANALGWTPAQLFAWANSRDGRWYADEAISSTADVPAAAAKYLR
jgi:hypothetical protein